MVILSRYILSKSAFCCKAPWKSATNSVPYPRQPGGQLVGRELGVRLLALLQLAVDEHGAGAARRRRVRGRRGGTCREGLNLIGYFLPENTLGSNIFQGKDTDTDREVAQPIL